MLLFDHLAENPTDQRDTAVKKSEMAGLSSEYFL